MTKFCCQSSNSTKISESSINSVILRGLEEKHERTSSHEEQKQFKAHAENVVLAIA